ncbi:hypothetical protein BDV24DRAFT_167624 [Aspergillus arachidicola]|uniref:Uncharacterized protein n=1 Tax=Aspergillus arachidicola TaxID=656916 RepID=A0A5N6XWQ2_9EURO|nr:hypothetical protein BDV24DRAFT_167624 [Aspergillus arachidicola]
MHSFKSMVSPVDMPLTTNQPFNMTKPEEVQAEYHEHVQKVEQSEQDVIYQTYASQSPEWHRKKTKQLLRKVDFHLLPCLIVMYLLNFLDRKYVPLVPQQSQRN